MKRSLLPLLAALLVLPASSEETSQDNSKPAPSTLTSEEKLRILSTTSRMLDDAIAYKGDGTASTIYRSNGRRLLLEMRGLVVRQLIHGSVAIEEREAGVSRRFYAQLHTSGYRTSTSDGANWSEWNEDTCPIFPSHILIEEIDGQLTISAQSLAKFTPSPNPDAVRSTGKLMPHERIVAQR